MDPIVVLFSYNMQPITILCLTLNKNSNIYSSKNAL